MLTEITISGFGGQGVLFFGKCLAQAAMLAGLNVSHLPSYGPQMRGGTANCAVCISDEPIGSPQVINADIAVVMNTPSFDKFEQTVKPGGSLFVDSSVTNRKSTRTDISCTYVEASKLAEENSLFGSSNIILLGSVIKSCSIGLKGIDCNAVSQAFRMMTEKANLFDKNIAALAIGMNAV